MWSQLTLSYINVLNTSKMSKSHLLFTVSIGKSLLSFCYHSVNVISLSLSKSDHMKWLPLYVYLLCNNFVPRNHTMCSCYGSCVINERSSTSVSPVSILVGAKASHPGPGANASAYLYSVRINIDATFRETWRTFWKHNASLVLLCTMTCNTLCLGGFNS